MGLPTGPERPSSFGLRSPGLVPETIEVRTAVQSIRGTVQNIFREGAFISSDGKLIYYGVNEMTVPPTLVEDFNAGRITQCKPKEVTQDITPNANESRMFIIPPNSHLKLAYDEGEKGGLGIWLLHGLNDDGTLLEENLYAMVSHPIQAFVALAKRRLIKAGIPVGIYPPKRIVNKALKELAMEDGLGERNAAVKKIREEMKLTAQKADDFTRRT